MVRALRVEKGEKAQLVDVDERTIGGERRGSSSAGALVTIDVTHSSLNYKDALALTGRPGVIRAERLIAGIDLVGTRRDTGERVLVTGRGMGETHDGGLAEVARVREEWLVPVPDRFSNTQAAAIGTAGYTAALACGVLHGIAEGEVVVTGATGGVGSVAIMLLTAARVPAVAVTGKSHEHDYLRHLGATAIIDRADLTAAGKPLQSERWAGGIDTVAGPMLANILSQTRAGGIVAACGMAAAGDLHTSIMPFILRAVTLAGINSVLTPVAERDAAWRLLDRDLDTDLLDGLTTSIGLDAAVAQSERLLAGQVTGRVVVDVRA